MKLLLVSLLFAIAPWSVHAQGSAPQRVIMEGGNSDAGSRGGRRSSAECSDRSSQCVQQCRDSGYGEVPGCASGCYNARSACDAGHAVNTLTGHPYLGSAWTVRSWNSDAGLDHSQSQTYRDPNTATYKEYDSRAESRKMDAAVRRSTESVDNETERMRRSNEDAMRIIRQSRPK